MSPGTQGTLVLVATLIMLMSGIPVAFGLGAVSIIFLLLFHGFDSMHVVPRRSAACRAGGLLRARASLAGGSRPQ